ncbi:MAG: TnpV protein [Lachnospiraceae bacterium]|nr:TnpV protein [Lachnospiraceae bacterium]
MRTKPLMKFTYQQGIDGMMYPNIQISKNLQNDIEPVGRFGSQWKDYMMEKYPHRLSELIAQGRLNEIILQIDKEAEHQKEILIKELLKAWPIPDTEETMKRAGYLKMITKEAEEMVMEEIVLKVR